MEFTVLGASGFIGRNLVRSLINLGYKVYSFGHDLSGFFEINHTHVIYCIGLTADFRSRPYDTVRSHISVLAEILEKGKFESLLYLSSTRIYARNRSSKENSKIAIDPSEPLDLYNLSKLTGECLCKASKRSNIKVARISNVIGFDIDSKNFLILMIKEALSGTIKLQSALCSSKDYILLEDVISLLPKIALGGKFWLYNVASGINISNAQVTDALIKLTGCKLILEKGAPTYKFPQIDVSRIKKEFNFNPSNFIDTLPTLLDYYKNTVVI